MPESKPVSSVLEIFERGPVGPHAIAVPNVVRLNGVELMTPDDHPIKVHEVNLEYPGLVYATVTLVCRKVSIGFESEV